MKFSNLSRKLEQTKAGKLTRDTLDWQSSQPNVALAGVVGSVAVALITLTAVLLAGLSILESLLIAWGAQMISFIGILAMGYRRVRRQEYACHNEDKAFGGSCDPSDVWRSYGRLTSISCPLQIAVFGRDTVQSRIIGTDLAGLGHDVHHSTDSDAILNSICDQPETWDLLIFDLDSGPCLDTSVDDLMDFRQACPHIPIILLSSTAKKDDFSCHRKSIGDVTLYKPVFRNRLLEGLDNVGLDT
ncbi:CheY chemotaxis protein or a CheY-like REC (receiver) domain [Roseovarius litoreus]|uniref:CheY chemotaxis protein or a CheY-like REC (Receiver) domain n=1 Tax=Roseovarius litoreus TaxID=1155722 RepID=A0A1M7KZ91_9RHOB|nr:response regulator [Roseovarius litoreus]SHM70714.1 CheY chemotaxis protein or a CheY-like REC (receiver) domain [Roseovarius litoreus]